MSLFRVHIVMKKADPVRSQRTFTIVFTELLVSSFTGLNNNITISQTGDQLYSYTSPYIISEGSQDIVRYETLYAFHGW